MFLVQERWGPLSNTETQSVLPTNPDPAYADIAHHAVPLRAGCYDCDATWGDIGGNPREAAREHAVAEKHMIWVECAPPKD
jgi:hypothetical protein